MAREGKDGGEEKKRRWGPLSLPPFPTRSLPIRIFGILPAKDGDKTDIAGPGRGRQTEGGGKERRKKSCSPTEYFFHPSFHNLSVTFGLHRQILLEAFPSGRSEELKYPDQALDVTFIKKTLK
jgi:hypothetical protein